MLTGVSAVNNDVTISKRRKNFIIQVPKIRDS